MSTWAVTLLYAGNADESTLVEWDERLDATVAAIPDRGFSVTLYEDDSDLLAAARRARTRARRVIPHGPVGVEVLTEDEFERRAGEPSVPELFSAGEAANVLGVSRQRIHQLRAEHPRFPAPLYELRTGPLWTRDAIEWFVSVWNRTPGRPARAVS